MARGLGRCWERETTEETVGDGLWMKEDGWLGMEFRGGEVAMEGPRRRGRRFLPWGEGGGWCVFFISFPDTEDFGEVWLTTWQQENVKKETSAGQEMVSSCIVSLGLARSMNQRDLMGSTDPDVFCRKIRALCLVWTSDVFTCCRASD